MKNIKNKILFVIVIALGVLTLYSSISLGEQPSQNDESKSGAAQDVSDDKGDNHIELAVNRLISEGFSKKDAYMIIGLTGSIEQNSVEAKIKKLLKEGKTWEEIEEIAKLWNDIPQKRETLTKDEVLALYNKGNCLENIFRAQDMYIMGQGESVDVILREVNKTYPPQKEKREYEEMMIEKIKESKDMREFREKINAEGSQKPLNQMTQSEIKKLKDDYAKKLKEK